MFGLAVAHDNLVMSHKPSPSTHPTPLVDLCTAHTSWLLVDGLHSCHVQSWLPGMTLSN